MVFAPSVGDILMMSQVAWKVGRAFSKGNDGARSEFGEIEREAESLSEALKLVAETLCDDDSLLTQSPGKTRAAFGTILESAQRTLRDLNSFIERFQVLRKTDTGSGFIVERTWTKALLQGYKTMEWTTEGGNITDLRNMLSVHAESINLALQALQSGSLARLEKTVVPMADTVGSIHDEVHGQLGPKIDDIHRLLMALASGTPLLDYRHSYSSPHQGASAGNQASPLLLPAMQENTLQLQRPGPLQTPVTAARVSNAGYVETDSRCVGIGADRVDSGSYGFHTQPHIRSSSSPTWLSGGDLPANRSSSISAQSRSSTALEDLPPANVLSIGRRDSATSSLNARMRESSLYAESQLLARLRSSSCQAGAAEAATEKLTDKDNPSLCQAPAAATPTSLFSHSRKGEARPTETRAAKAKAFEQAIFNDSVTLCDVRATSLEYAKRNPDEPDPRFGMEMVEASEEARLCVVRKRERKNNGQLKMSTLIWTLATDHSVRVRQKLPEAETIPYCSCFEATKVSIPAVDGETVLRFHDEVLGSGAISEISSSWINYFFGSEDDASAFQSAIYGRRLIGSYRTVKTTVLHEGLKGAFAFEEQFANIERLRLWEDDGIATPGAAGGVQALMHVSSNFGEGFARWWLNNSKQPVRAKDDGGNFVKIKGLDLTIAAPSGFGPNRRRPSGRSGHLKQPDKRVEGIRVEFKSETEKKDFLTLWKRVQETMYPLPAI